MIIIKKAPDSVKPFMGCFIFQQKEVRMFLIFMLGVAPVLLGNLYGLIFDVVFIALFGPVFENQMFNALKLSNKYSNVPLDIVDWKQDYFD